MKLDVTMARPLHSFIEYAPLLSIGETLILRAEMRNSADARPGNPITLGYLYRHTHTTTGVTRGTYHVDESWYAAFDIDELEALPNIAWYGAFGSYDDATTFLLGACHAHNLIPAVHAGWTLPYPEG